MGLFSGSVPPWFVLSNNLSTTNTRAIWLCFGAFLSPPASSLQFHWPLATDHHSPVPRSTPHAGTSGVRSCVDPPPWLLSDTDRQLSKTERGPISTNGPSIIEYITEPGDSCGEINPLFLARRRRT